MKKKIPTYSIVSVIFNDFRALRNFYNSLTLFESDFELVLVYNPGDVQVLDYAFELSTCDSRIKLIENKLNIGLAAANQIGIDAAVGEYIYVVNPDVFWIMPVLESLRKRFDKADISFISPLNLDERGVSHCHWHSSWTLLHMIFYRTLPLRLIESVKSILVDYDLERKVGYVSGSSIFSKADVFKEIKYDPRMFLSVEDVADLCDRANLKYAKPSLVFPEVCTVHIGGTSHDGNKWTAWVFAARGACVYLNKRGRFRMEAFYRIYMTLLVGLKQCILMRKVSVRYIKVMWRLTSRELSDVEVVKYLGSFKP